LVKQTRGRKSRDTVPLSIPTILIRDLNVNKNCRDLAIIILQENNEVFVEMITYLVKAWIRLLAWMILSSFLLLSSRIIGSSNLAILSLKKQKKTKKNYTCL
jgi:hypothetical protein